MKMREMVGEDEGGMNDGEEEGDGAFFPSRPRQRALARDDERSFFVFWRQNVIVRP
jgi:hypothetical protein